ncbi:MAG: FimV/HubP family polar landmark protein [Dokdonella sp.]
MKRPLQLPLAIALALGGTNALALGLGPVHVNSKLNQPLDAEIPVLQGGAGEAEGLLVNLAAAEDFDRIGLNRSRLNVPLEFAIGKNAKGEPVIKVTSKEPVRDSFLDFLVEANWPKGRLLREYTILLDPPVTAPATARAATTTAVPASPGTVTLSRRDKPVEKAAPAVAAAPRASAAAKPAAAAPVGKASDGKYGPVEAGQTLSEIAHATGEGRNVNQMMLALWKSNPGAFYKDNINALKRGAILRIPSADEIKAVGSTAEAATQVQSQVEDWRGGRASPTLVADAGSKAEPAATLPKKAATTSASTTPAKSSSERLELVPPKAGKDSIAMADRPGGGGAGSAGANELKSELARAKEALTARNQETGELKSRVKELEDLKGKNDRLIGLKDSEIAELQQKLKQMQDGKPSSTVAKSATTTPLAGSATAAGAAVTATMPAPGADKISKQDIWGEAGTAKGAPATEPGKPALQPTTTTPATPTSTAVAPAPLTPSSSSSTPSTSTSATPAAPSSSTTPASSTPPAATITTPTTTPVPIPATPPAKPAAATPAKPVVKPKPAPAPEPWYSASWVMPAALGGGALLLLLGFFGLRKRKVAPVDVGRGSIAGAFGDSPFGAPGDVDALSAHEAEETKLREMLQHDPHNVGLHLELLSLYYAERDIAKFEHAAADMHAYVTDPHQPEWLEAQAMGQELAPHNALFAGTGQYDDRDTTFSHAHDDDDHPHTHADDAFATPVYRRELPAPTHASDHHDSDLAFDLDDAHLGAPPAAPVHVAKHESFDFDLPPLDMDPPPPAHQAHNGHDLHVHTPAASPPAARLDDDYFPGEDAVGTKLDLAKAYMDMGDPEGARSMLEEVVAEGSDAQKSEAHRLMAEIR